MRCTKTYIPKTQRLGKQIFELCQGGLSSPSFSQYIVSKYSGSKLTKFKFAILTLLKKNNQNSIENVTQILKSEVINAAHTPTELEVNLNLFFFWNTAVQRLLKEENKYQPQKLLTVNLNLFYTTSIKIAKIWQLQTHKLVSMGLEQRLLKQTVLLLRSQTNLNQFNQRVESNQNLNLATDTRSLNLKSIRNVTDNLTYQFFNEPQQINSQQRTNEILYKEKRNRQHQKWLINNLTFFENNSILINKTSQLKNYQLTNNLINDSDYLAVPLRVNKLEKPYVNLLLSRHNLDIRLLSAKYEKFIYIRNTSALIDEIKSKHKYFTLLSFRQQFHTQLQSLMNYKKEQEYAEVEHYPFQILRAKPDISRFPDSKVNQLKSREFNEFENESENLISRQNSQAREDLSNENTDLKLQLTSTNISTVNKTSMLISTAYKRNFNLISKLQNIETQSILQHRKNASNSEILSFAPHHIRTKQWKQSPKTLIRQQTDNYRLENQQYKRHQLYSNTPELELIKFQPKVSQISNKNEGKKESKNATKDDYAKQNQINSNIQNIDMNLLTNQIFQRLEQKIRIERQRRGIL